MSLQVYGGDWGALSLAAVSATHIVRSERHGLTSNWAELVEYLLTLGPPISRKQYKGTRRSPKDHFTICAYPDLKGPCSTQESILGKVL
jgi:hypothetical protein